LNLNGKTKIEQIKSVKSSINSRTKHGGKNWSISRKWKESEKWKNRRNEWI